MKKILSLVLVIVMLMSMTVTAFAADEQSGTTTLTTVVPSPEWTLTIPATVDIPYGSTELSIAKPTVTNVSGFKADDTVVLSTTWTNLISGENTIPITIVFDSYLFGSQIHNHVDPLTYAEYLYVQGQERELEYFAIIEQSAWDAAKPGNYSATVTFTSSFLAAS